MHEYQIQNWCNGELNIDYRWPVEEYLVWVTLRIDLTISFPCPLFFPPRGLRREVEKIVNNALTPADIAGA